MSTDLGPFGRVWEGLQKRQDAHEKRLEWLRSLKTGDEVLLRWQDHEHVAGGPREERVTVKRRGYGLFTSKFPRRDVFHGRWERGGKTWAWLHIDPVEAQP